MDNTILVRTDIIDPHTYLEIEMHYKDLLQILFLCGGYALFQQIYKYYGGKSKGYREIKKMEDLLLVGTEQFNNNKYVYLKITALKYLKYKDQDVIDGELTVFRIPPKPSYRPIMNSIYSFEYMLQETELLSTESGEILLNIFIDDVVRAFEKNRLENFHLSRVIKPDFKERLIQKMKYLAYRSGIFLRDYISGSSLNDSILYFVWYDIDQDIGGKNPILKVLSIISNFLNFVGTKNKLNCCKFTLEIVTYSKEREQIMRTLSDKALKRIEKSNKYHLKSNSKSNKVISNIHNISFKVLPDVEGYIKKAVRGDNEFSFVDIDTVERIEKLKEVIKNSKQ